MDGVKSVVLVPDVPGIEFVGAWGSAEELRAFAERFHDGLTLICNVFDTTHDDLLLLQLRTHRGPFLGRETAPK